MALIRVWSPEAREIELITGSLSCRLTRDSTAWWSVDAPDFRHGTEYALRVDGAGPLPDPRSPWQPAGVHGQSCWIDHSQYRWHDQGWQPPPLESAVIYETHVGTFTAEGTFDAAQERLDHLVELGITHVELMPVAEFSGNRGWGYDGVDLYAPHHAYGGPEGLKRLVDCCHLHGLAVLLDVVYNHLGPAGNYLGHFAPYFTGRYRTPWGKAVNLDGPESNEVRRFLIDNALMWLRDYHFDGLRIDAVHAIMDMSAIHFLDQLAAEVRELKRRLGRRLVLIAESDLNDPRVIRTPRAGGYGLDAQWNEDFHHALHSFLTGERNGYYADFGGLADLAKALRRGLVYDGRYSRFRGRNHGRPATGLSGHRFVGCLQNHDQVGNRALGERTSHLLSKGLLKVGATLVMIAPFVPMLFQGEEWGASRPFLYFTNHVDPELADAVHRGRREEFVALGWDPASVPDPQAEETFLRSKLDWEERGRQPHAELLAWYRSLISLRQKSPALNDGRMRGVRVHTDPAGRWLTVRRGTMLIACNFSQSALRIPCASLATGLPGGPAVILASEDGVLVEDGEVLIPGEAAAILDLDRSPVAGRSSMERRHRLS